MSQSTLALAVVLVVASVACTRRDDTVPGDASTTSAEVPGRTGRVPARESVFAPPATDAAREMEQPVTRGEGRPPATGTPPAETPAPSWVPDSGRLTIVEARDLARNLGLDAAAAPPPAPAPAPAP